MTPTRLVTGVLVFPDVEVLDFCGPFEVFSVTRRDPARRREEPSPFDAFLVAETADPVAASGGMRVLPAHTFATCPPLDVLVVPGGWGTRREADNPRLVGWVARQAAGARLVTSVCTGSFLLGAAGLLRGRRATTHWASLDRMRAAFPDVRVDERAQWVEDGAVLTSAGIAAGIDMALRVVARVCGEEVARETAKYMEYPYSTDDRRRDPIARASWG
ncbi:MAG: AraC family transcriptional regulator [Isosphaera sp.]|nr:AraC family transcriptional regulator [Isosphaera sp.]